MSGLSNWNVNTVMDFTRMFSRTGITNLESLSSWKVNPDANFTEMFSNCNDLVDCSGIDS